jgi:hypothetical protein
MNSFTDTPNEESVVARLTGCVLENAWFEAGEVAINEPSQCFDEKRSRSVTVAPISAPKLDEGHEANDEIASPDQRGAGRLRNFDASRQKRHGVSVATLIPIRGQATRADMEDLPRSSNGGSSAARPLKLPSMPSA